MCAAEEGNRGRAGAPDSVQIVHAVSKEFGKIAGTRLHGGKSESRGRDSRNLGFTLFDQFCNLVLSPVL